MVSKQSTIDLILEQKREAGAVRAKRMFGEYGLYCGNPFCVVCDDQLCMKPTRGGALPRCEILLPDSGRDVDDAEQMTALVTELPPPTPEKAAGKPRKVRG